MYLCEVAIVSQLCISFPYVLHGLCEDYLTCDIAFNAVMPPSRASPRGRYSHLGILPDPSPPTSARGRASFSLLCSSLLFPPLRPRAVLPSRAPWRRSS